MIRLLFFFSFLSSCSINSVKKIEENYDGPLIEIKDLLTSFTDSAQVRFELKSKLYLVYKAGEEVYPKGLFMDIYSKNSEIVTATFKANYVIKYEDKNYFMATGNVILNNIISGDIFWYPNEEKFSSEKFVTIKTGNEIHSGEGMVSNQDFSSYEILKPTGIIDIDEN